MLFPIDGSCDYDELVGKMKKRRSEIGPKQPPTASSRYLLITPPNLRHDLITAKVSRVIPQQSDWSIMMSLLGKCDINITNFATLICGI